MRHYDDFPLDGTIEQDIVCFHHIDNHHASPFHKHDHHIELFLFLNGDVKYFTKKTSFKLKPGDFVMVPPGVWHRANTMTNKKYERVFINIKVSKIKELSTKKTDLFGCFIPKNNFADVNVLKLTRDEQRSFINHCHQIIAELGRNDYGHDIRLNILQAQILLGVNGAFKGKKWEDIKSEPTRIQKILDYIDAHVDQDLKLADIAQEFYLNPDYLNRYFHHEIGLSLHNYIRQVRLSKARYLLLNGESLSETAVKCGYQNYSSFIRAFTDFTGIAPGKFKRINQKHNQKFNEK